MDRTVLLYLVLSEVRPLLRSDAEEPFSVVVDAMLFDSDVHALPLAWYARLRSVLAPLLAESASCAIYVLYPSTHVVEFLRDALRRLKMRPHDFENAIAFVAAPSDLARHVPNAAKFLPASTVRVERSLDYRWRVTVDGAAGKLLMLSGRFLLVESKIKFVAKPVQVRTIITSRAIVW